MSEKIYYKIPVNSLTQEEAEHRDIVTARESVDAAYLLATYHPVKHPNLDANPQAAFHPFQGIYSTTTPVNPAWIPMTYEEALEEVKTPLWTGQETLPYTLPFTLG